MIFSGIDHTVQREPRNGRAIDCEKQCVEQKTEQLHNTRSTHIYHGVIVLLKN